MVVFDLWGLEQKVVLGYQYSNQDFTAYARSTDTKMEIGNFFEWNGSMPEPVWNAPTLNENIILNKMHYSLRLI